MLPILSCLGLFGKLMQSSMNVKNWFLRIIFAEQILIKIYPQWSPINTNWCRIGKICHNWWGQKLREVRKELMKYTELEDVMFKHVFHDCITSQQVLCAEWLYVNEHLVCCICCYRYAYHESQDHFWDGVAHLSIGIVLCSLNKFRAVTEFFFWIKRFMLKHC